MAHLRAKSKLIWGAFSAVCGFLSAVYMQPLVHRNNDLNNLIITIFTVFSGVVMALITAIGDPALMPIGSWRSAENSRNRIDSQLIRQSFLFGFYLFVILLFLACTLMKGMPDLSPFETRVVKRLESVYIGLAVFAFLLSLTLPLTMLKLQRKRLDIEIERRRRDANVPRPTPLQSVK